MILLLLVVSWVPTQDERRRRELRVFLEDHAPTMQLRFDEDPLRRLLDGRDPVTEIVGLIDVLGEEKESREPLARGGLRVLAEYRKLHADQRIDEFLRSFSKDRSWNSTVRREAVSCLVNVRSPLLHATTIEALEAYQELASPILAALHAAARGITSEAAFPLKEAYTPEVRAALRAYYDRRRATTGALPEHLEWGEKLIVDLDRIMSGPPGPQLPAPGLSVRPSVEVPASSPSSAPLAESPRGAQSGGSLRTVAVAGLAAACLLFLVTLLRHRKRAA